MSRIDEKTKNQIARLYTGSDLAVHEICHILNVSPSVIYNTLNEKGIPRKRTASSNSDIEVAVKMYEQGYYLNQIFDNTNIS